jgi:predicted Zn-dependent protease
MVWPDCLISPNAGGDSLRYVELAEQALQKRPGSYAYLNTLGAALYRAGRYTDAIAQLHAGIQAHDRKEGNSIDWVFLAMAYARAGDREQAHLWLQKTIDAPELTEWWQQVEVRALRQEAEAVVQGIVLPTHDKNSL